MIESGGGMDRMNSRAKLFTTTIHIDGAHLWGFGNNKIKFSSSRTTFFLVVVVVLPGPLQLISFPAPPLPILIQFYWIAFFLSVSVRASSDTTGCNSRSTERKAISRIFTYGNGQSRRS